MRNIGRSSSKELAGGTFGFGKSVFFIISQVSTVLVYTRTTDEHGEPVNRFIAMANGESFDINGVPYTGRHWWGLREIEETEANRIEYAEPIVGEQADRLASILGMSAHFTDLRPSGTCVAIINPMFEDDPDKHLTDIARSLTRWAWPHMLPIETGMDPIDFKVSMGRTEIDIPDPTYDPALKRFVSMYEQAINPAKPTSLNSWQATFAHRTAHLSTLRPCVQPFGSLAVTNMRKPIAEDETVLDIEVSSQIATMRNPRMVVEYYKGPLPLSGTNYCGVFIADPHADEVFARSEPAAHHQWNHQSANHDPSVLARFWEREKPTNVNPIRVFFERLNKLLGAEPGMSNVSSDDRNYTSLTKLSSRLGTAIANAQGGTDLRSPRVSKRRSSSGSKPSNNSPTGKAVLKSLNLVNGDIVATFKCEISIPSSGTSYSVSPKAFLVSDKGRIKEGDLRDAGASAPVFLGWLTSKRDPNPLALQPGVHSLEAEFIQPPASAMGVDFSFEALTESDRSPENV